MQYLLMIYADETKAQLPYSPPCPSRRGRATTG
jgi:hypothetical protein